MHYIALYLIMYNISNIHSIYIYHIALYILSIIIYNIIYICSPQSFALIYLHLHLASNHIFNNPLEVYKVEIDFSILFSHFLNMGGLFSS